MAYTFEITQKVRDYECDMQGIVNNAVYLSYMEHARHEYLEHKGVSFKTLVDKGQMAMVSNLEVRFRSSLRSGDTFAVRLRTERRGPKLIFWQDIFRLPEEELCVSAKVDVICVEDGKLSRGDAFDGF